MNISYIIILTFVFWTAYKLAALYTAHKNGHAGVTLLEAFIMYTLNLLYAGLATAAFYYIW